MTLLEKENMLRLCILSTTLKLDFYSKLCGSAETPLVENLFFVSVQEAISAAESFLARGGVEHDIDGSALHHLCKIYKKYDSYYNSFRCFIEAAGSDEKGGDEYVRTFLGRLNKSS